MTHQKRLSAPKHYPIKRKETTYTTETKGSRSTENSIPAVIFLREVTQYAENKKEAKEIIKKGQLKRNNIAIKDIREGLGTLDLIEIPETEEKFRVIRTKNNLEFRPTQSNKVLVKIIDKTQEGEKFVYRLHNGENYSTKDEFNTQSTLAIEDGAEEIKMEEGGTVLVTKGKHAGKTAEIKEIKKRGLNKKTAVVEAETEYETNVKNLLPIKKELISE